MIKIAIIDDEQDQILRTTKHLKEVFGDLKNREIVFLEFLISEHNPDLAAYEKLIVADRPHVVFCDNRIGRVESWGHKFIARIKKLLPETVMCLLTRHTLGCQHFGASTPNPDLIVHKGPLGGDVSGYGKYVFNEIKSNLKRISNVTVSWQCESDTLFSSRLSRRKSTTIEQVNSLIEQCLFCGDIDESSKHVDVGKLEGGRSGSVNLSCRLKGELTYGVTGVIKISPIEKSLQEIANYNTYVKWVLPYTWRVEVLGTGFTDEMGAVCYSFAFDGDGNPLSCTSLLRIADANVVNLICGTIFNPNSKTWYSRLRPSGSDASDYFQQKRFNSPAGVIEERLDQFLNQIGVYFGNSFQQSDREIALFEHRLPHPRTWLWTSDWGAVEECVCHGDLNANNILINSNGGRAAFIDFQDTGYHNIFRDFVSFESSIRIEWGIAEELGFLERERLEILKGGGTEELMNRKLRLWKDKALEGDYKGELREMLEMEIGLAMRSVSGLSDHLAQIEKVRGAAFSNFETNTMKDREALYLMASYVHFSWLVVRFPDWTRTSEIRLILGAFAALIALYRLKGSAKPNTDL